MDDGVDGRIMPLQYLDVESRLYVDCRSHVGSVGSDGGRMVGGVRPRMFGGEVGPSVKREWSRAKALPPFRCLAHSLPPDGENFGASVSSRGRDKRRVTDYCLPFSQLSLYSYHRHGALVPPP